VARGKRDSLAICCWVRPRAWRSWRTLAARRAARSSVTQHPLALFQKIVNGSKERSRPAQIVGMNQQEKAAVVPETALITGASRGLGAALGRALAARGTRVVLVARGEAELAAVVSSIRAAGGEAHAFVADVADKRDVYPLAGAAADLVGPIELLVNNASELGRAPLRLLFDTECEELERVLAVNVLGPFRLSKAVGGAMAIRRSGTIVNVSSDAAVNAYARWGGYSASKAALDQLGRVLAVELAEHGVRVLSVDPGEMNTAMHRAALPDADPHSLLDPAVVAERIVALLERGDLPIGARVVLGEEVRP
jgi:NAD(P)-dependent dehydrogenase (short-subunit alcohol dehydrogenase family)